MIYLIHLKNNRVFSTDSVIRNPYGDYVQYYIDGRGQRHSYTEVRKIQKIVCVLVKK